VRDPEGKIISDTGEKPSRSFVIQFLEFLYGIFRGTTTSATATDGTEDSIVLTYSAPYWIDSQAHFRVDAPINTSLYGIVVGTNDGVVAESNTDYALDTQIAHGSGAGQMTHGASVVGATGVVGANVDLILTRAFTNNSGSAISDVKEAGIYVRYWYSFVPATYYYHCIVRDVFTAIEVPDKCSLTIYYTVRTTV